MNVPTMLLVSALVITSWNSVIFCQGERLRNDDTDVPPVCKKYTENTICRANSYFGYNLHVCDMYGNVYDNICEYLKAVCAGEASYKIDYQCHLAALGGNRRSSKMLFTIRSFFSLPSASLYETRAQHQRALSHHNTPCVNMTVSPLPDTLTDLHPFFDKYLSVFGVNMVATDGVPDVKMVHAAGVMAQYLDNNGDGHVDNPAVVQSMKERNGMLVMFKDQDECDAKLVKVKDATGGKYYIQDLEGSEVHPQGEGHGAFDGSLEEILHLIQDTGFTYVFPESFAQNENSVLGKIMLKAIKDCGFAFNNTFRYPSCSGVYHYGDRTCNFACLMSEFFYWGLTSVLGAQSDRHRCQWISIEWELCTKRRVETKLPELYRFLIDKEYSLPTVLPDGKYNHVC